jgi:hypothetical protein
VPAALLPKRFRRRLRMWCGYMPVKASVAAAKAVAGNPTASNRSFAAEIGIDHKTVAKARALVGRDGKTRKMPTPAYSHEDADEADSVTVDISRPNRNAGTAPRRSCRP